jgi:hypothetical protein
MELSGSIDIERYRQSQTSNVAQTDTNYRKVEMTSVTHHITVSCAADDATYMAEIVVVIRVVLDFS